MIRHRLCLALFISVFTVGLLVPLLRPGTAAAEGEQYAWIDNNNIRISAGDLSAPATAVYNESANFAGLRVFQANAAHNSGCSLYLEVLVGFTQGEVVSSRVTAPSPPSSSGGNCSAAIRQTYQNKTITIAGNPGGAPASMVNYNVKVWSPKTFDESPATIVLQSKTSAGQNITSVTTPKNKADAGTDGSGNQISEAAFYQAQLLLFKGSSYQLCSNDSSILTCTPFTVPANYAGAIDEFNTRPNFAPNNQNSCESQLKGVGWLTCPVITTSADAAEKLSNLVVCLLKLNTETLFNTSSETGTASACEGDPNPEASSAYHAAWAGFRNIAYAILVIFGLIMVASQVFNLELLNAYTLRKMLFKLIIAIPIITVSWEGMEFLYRFSNAAADALMDIIRAAFSGVGSVRDVVAEGRPQDALGSAVGTILAKIGLGVGAYTAGGVVVLYALFGGFGVILSLVASLALGLFSVFVLLAARNVAADLAVIIAPIAIILKTFGPTEKGGSAWQALVVALVVSVPGAATVLAMTGMAALIAAAAGTVISTITAVIILIAGFALLWTLFLQMDKITGFMGNVANKVTGRAQKALAGYRSNTMKRQFGEVLSGQRDLGTVGKLMRYGSLMGRPGMSGNILDKANRQKLAFAENAMIGRTGQELLKNEDGSVSGNDDAMAVITQGVGSDEDYDNKYVTRKRAQHERKNPGIAWTGEMESEAREEARTTRAEIVGRMGSPINSRATRRAASHARWTSTSAYNDWDLETEAGRRGMRAEMAEEIGAMMVNGGMTMNEVAATLKKNSQRTDISGHSFPQIMFQAQEIAKRYRARREGRAVTRGRRMTAEGGIDLDPTTGQAREDDLYIIDRVTGRPTTVTAGTRAQTTLMTEGEMEAWDRRSIEYTTAGQRIGQRTESVRLQAEVMRSRLVETVEQNRDVIARINLEVDTARREAQAVQADLEQASAYETRVINSPNPGIPPQQFALQQQAAQEQTRRIRERAVAAQQRVAMAQRRLDESQLEVIRQMATGSAEHTVMSSYASPENARWFDKLYSSQQMPGQPPGVTIMDYMEQLRQSSDVFRRFERSYTQSASASAQAALASTTAATAPGGAIPGAGPPVP